MTTVVHGHFANRADSDELKRLDGERVNTERLLHGLMGARHNVARRRHVYGRVITALRDPRISTAATDDTIIGLLLDQLAVMATLYHERETSRSKI